MPSETLLQPDVLIAGAGIIGLSLALELESRGASVVVVDPHAAFRKASFAAAGMLAAHDPHLPAPLLPLAGLSLSLYPGWLARLQTLGECDVPWQTTQTIQYLAGDERRILHVHSIDPRQLAAALLAAVGATSIQLHEHVGCVMEAETAAAIFLRTASGLEVYPRTLVHATGAWFYGRQCIVLRKGQMLRVQLPPSLAGLNVVHRSENVYVVPRTCGPQAGTALIGATVEDAGFDTSVHRRDLSHLRGLAADLLPALADEAAAPQVEAWAGIRPGTPDELPLMGPLRDGGRQWVSTGHFRNGILLAPASAHVMADRIEGTPTTISLTAFSPQRFVRADKP